MHQWIQNKKNIITKIKRKEKIFIYKKVICLFNYCNNLFHFYIKLYRNDNYILSGCDLKLQSKLL